MDFDDLASRLGIDRDDFMELVELFVTTTEADMEKIRKAAGDENPKDAASAAHSIKGAAGNLGFGDMAEVAKKMEFQGKDGDLTDFDKFLDELDRMLQAVKDRL